jgi:hypothetical protein
MPQPVEVDGIHAADLSTPERVLLFASLAAAH